LLLSLLVKQFFKTCERLAMLQAHGHWGTVLVKDEEFAIDFM